MVQRLVSRVLVGSMLVLPLVVSAAAPQDFRPADKKIDVAQPPAGAPNLSITMPQTGDQLARLRFSSESKHVDATAQRIEVTYTKAGLTVELVSGKVLYTHTVSPWQSRSQGEFKTLSLTFGTNGELVDVQMDKKPL